METSKVAKPTDQNQTQPNTGRILPADELKKLTDFFSILIEIDQRNKQERRKNEQKFPDKETVTETD